MYSLLCPSTVSMFRHYQKGEVLSRTCHCFSGVGEKPEHKVVCEGKVKTGRKPTYLNLRERVHKKDKSRESHQALSENSFSSLYCNRFHFNY